MEVVVSLVGSSTISTLVVPPLPLLAKGHHWQITKYVGFDRFLSWNSVKNLVPPCTARLDLVKDLCLLISDL